MRRRSLRRSAAARTGSKCSEYPGSLDIFGCDDRVQFEHKRKCLKRRECNWFRHCGWFSDLVVYDHDCRLVHSHAVAHESKLGAESLLRQRDYGNGVAGDAASLA